MHHVNELIKNKKLIELTNTSRYYFVFINTLQY